MEHLAHGFDVAKSTVIDTITRVENVLVPSVTFRLPGKKALLSPENPFRISTLGWRRKHIIDCLAMNPILPESDVDLTVPLIKIELIR